jgi:hypothetical protein
VFNSPLKAYETVNKSTMSGREVEAAVLTKAARKLRECQNNWDAANRREKLTRSAEVQPTDLEYISGGVGQRGSSPPPEITPGYPQTGFIHRSTNSRNPGLPRA